MQGVSEADRTEKQTVWQMDRQQTTLYIYCQLYLSFAGNSATSSPHIQSPDIPASFSSFTPAFVSEIHKNSFKLSKQTVWFWSYSYLASQRMRICTCFPITNILSLSSLVSFIQFSTSLSSSPLLKKPTLDKDQIFNYRSISNLFLVSEIIENIVKSRLMDHLDSNRLLNLHQSAYTVNTIPLKLPFCTFIITSNAIRSQKVSCLCLRYHRT